MLLISIRYNVRSMYLGCRFYPFVYVEFSRIPLEKKWLTYISMYHQLSNSGTCTTLLSTGEWPMTMVKEILQQMPTVSKPQAQFLEALFAAILALRGRVNFRNLSRYCDYCERTIARQFRRCFDWPDFHQRVITVALDPCSEVISAQDASFIPKSGKQTLAFR